MNSRFNNFVLPRHLLIVCLHGLIGFIGAIALFGCAPPIQYVYTPPASPEGRICAAQCMNSQQQCQMFLSTQYRECQYRWNYEIQLYNQCRRNSGDNKNYCPYPPACYSPSTYQCDEQYRACYQLCGGQVQAIVPPKGQ